jgi:hypothetical protein
MAAHALPFRTAPAPEAQQQNDVKLSHKQQHGVE